MENEICPVYAALAVNKVQPHPEEVMDYHWFQLDDVIASVRHTPWVFSPWMVQLVSDSSALSALNTFVKNIISSQR
jgi:isopentenyl-diphosphate delta-isomerase